MTGQGRLLRGVLATALVLVAFACGLVSIRVAQAAAEMPEFTNEAKAIDLLANSGLRDDAEQAQWSRDYSALLTDKWPLRHSAEGWGLLSLSVGVFGALGLAVTLAGGDFLRTPRHPWQVRLPLTVAFLAQLPLSYWYFVRTTDEEHCCGAFEDSSGLAIFSFWFMVLVLLGLSALYFLPFIRAGRLPAVFFPKVSLKNGAVVLRLLYAVPPALLFGFLIFAGLEEMAFLVPLGVIGVWTTSVALAAALDPLRLKS